MTPANKYYFHFINSALNGFNSLICIKCTYSRYFMDISPSVFPPSCICHPFSSTVFALYTPSKTYIHPQFHDLPQICLCNWSSLTTFIKERVLWRGQLNTSHYFIAQMSKYFVGNCIGFIVFKQYILKMMLGEIFLYMCVCMYIHINV